MSELESVRYEWMKKSVTAGTAVIFTFSLMNYGEHVIESFQIWPRNDPDICQAYLTIRQITGVGGYRHIHTEGGYCNESFPLSLTRAVRVTSPVTAYAICESPSAQSVDCMIGIRRID